MPVDKVSFEYTNGGINDGSVGIKEHDQRHDEVERVLRRLAEQVAQLSIDLSVTRSQLRKVSLTVEGKVSEAELDPSVLTLNEGIKKARAKLAAAQDAADEQWSALNDEVIAALDDLRDEPTEGEA